MMIPSEPPLFSTFPPINPIQKRINCSIHPLPSTVDVNSENESGGQKKSICGSNSRFGFSMGRVFFGHLSTLLAMLAYPFV
jgi:hypothetical protein